MFVYCVEPCDWWFGWRRPQEVVIVPVEPMYDNEGGIPLDEWKDFWTKAREGAEVLHWEGDIREGPYISMLPQPGEVCWMVAWKQDNNGTTFIASPVELPWLGSDECGRECVELLHIHGRPVWVPKPVWVSKR